MSIYFELQEKINQSDMILIGLGEEFIAGALSDSECVKVLEQLEHILNHNNYFMIATFTDPLLRNSSLNQKRIVYPYLAESNEEEAKQWALYNKWLSATLAKKLLLIELGEGFQNPNIIRWPFERVTMINNQAELFRVHSELYQVPAELQNKASAYQQDAYQFIKEWLNDCE